MRPLAEAAEVDDPLDPSARAIRANAEAAARSLAAKFLDPP